MILRDGVMGVPVIDGRRGHAKHRTPSCLTHSHPAHIQVPAHYCVLRTYNTQAAPTLPNLYTCRTLYPLLDLPSFEHFIPFPIVAVLFVGGIEADWTNSTHCAVYMYMANAVVLAQRTLGPTCTCVWSLHVLESWACVNSEHVTPLLQAVKVREVA